MGQFDFVTRAERYTQAIAQRTSRKLAMLVGVNEYPDADIPSLGGCLTDIDLQYELLVNRFGFNPADIVRVTDTDTLKPNRETILQVFQEHLINQAMPGDVVVFHYSGHGSRVIDPNPLTENHPGSDSLNNLDGAIVPNDALSDGLVPDIMGRTLFLLMRSLKTDNVTAILDSCYSGGGLRGAGVIRAIRQSLSEPRQAHPAEWDLQQQLLEKANLSMADFQVERQAGIARGLGIGSTQSNELAIEVPYGGSQAFKAGAFTYLLTRYLWQIAGSASASSVQANIERSTQVIASAHSTNQVPNFEAAPNSNSLRQPINFTDPAQGPAEAVVKRVNGQQVEFWLGGVSQQALVGNGQQARFTAYNRQRELMGEIEQREREGLLGKGRVVSGQVSAGMLLRETLVGLPNNLQLVLGVDASLGSEVSAAVDALAQGLISQQTGLSQILAAPVDASSAVDYVLGRMTEEMREQLPGQSTLPTVGSVALFSPTLVPVAASHGLVDESAVGAVRRLRPLLKRLLANKALEAIAATHSSLAVSGEIVAASDANRSVPIGGGRAISPSIQPFRVGEDIQIRVENRETEQALYLTCLVIDVEGNMTVIHPAAWDAPDDAALIEKKGALVIPRPEDNTVFRIGPTDGTGGLVEVMTITSTGSLRNALRALQEIARGREMTRGYVSVDDESGLDFLTELLGDVDRISRSDGVGMSEGQTAVNGGEIAVFSTVIEVVAS